MKLCYSINAIDRQMIVQPVMSRAASHLSRDIYPVSALNLLNDSRSTLPREHKRILTILCAYRSNRGYNLNGSMACDLLEKLLATGRVFWVRNQRQPLKKAKKLKSDLIWKAEEITELFKPSYDYPSQMVLLPCSPPAVVDEKSARVQFLDVGLSAEACSVWHSRRAMDVVACQEFVSRLCREYPRMRFPPPPSLELCVLEDEAPRPVISIQSKPVSDSSIQAGLMLQVQFDYHGALVHADDEGERLRHVAGDFLYDIKRQKEVECTYIQRLEDWGLVKLEPVSIDLFAREQERHCFTPDVLKQRHWQHVLDDLFPMLKQHGWCIRQDEKTPIHSVQESEWYTTANEGSNDWFAFETGVIVEGQKINLLSTVYELLSQFTADDIAAIEEKLMHSSVPVCVDGRVLLIPGERLLIIIRHLFELFSTNALQKDGSLKLNEYRVAELYDMFDEPPSLNVHVERLRKACKSGLSIKPKNAPKDMLAELRPYQKLGLGWLEFLHTYHVGGILADDMGLGKTVQTLALLLKLKKARKLRQPVLIVAPTSVLPNWRHEIERFTPLLSCALHHGADRHGQQEKTLQHDIILTTYALLRNDVEWLSQHTFSWIILDEAQYIKNARSRTVKALGQLKGENRLCLTGTPMENHLGELWSLFNFIMPGFLGSYAYFKRTFQIPVERENHALLQDSLKNRMRPFMLRRTKALVEKDLPDKIEIIEAVALSQVQRDLYESVRLAMTTRIQQEMEEKGFARSKIMILDALLKLRQICCDPRLRDEKITHLDASCKMAWLRDQLPEMIENGRRILLFSQFTSMLFLIEKWLKKEKIGYVQLTGSTRDRSVPVQQFQAGEVPVFLISLKAGGTGLNLTAADTVIHYDPWWNPAAENQATDRAYRIGQDKHVFVYKLITECSVEERILQLQQRKANLADAILEKSASQTGLHFTEEDLAHLLAPIA